jgi:hypothetical protein
MVIENSNIYSIRFWAHWYFFVLVLAPFICFIDYYTVDQGFDKIYGATIIMLALLVLIGKGTDGSVFRDYLLVGLLLAFYYTTWDILLWQGRVVRKGIFYEFFLNRTLHTIAVLYVVDNILFSRKLIDALVFTMKGMIVIGAVVSLLQVIYDPFLFTPYKFEHMMLRYAWSASPLHVRRLSVFGFSNVNDIGVSFLPVMALITGYEVKEKGKIPVVMLLLGFFIAVVNNSRYIQLGFFVAAAPALLYQGRIIRNSLVALLGLIAMVIMMGFVLHLIGYDVGRYVEERLLDESGESRLLALDVFARFFPDAPFFGTGQHLTQEVVVALAGRSSQIHVGYLSHLFSYGIVGTSLALFFWGLIASRLWKVARRTGFYGSFFGFMIFLWANVTMVYFWIFTFGLALCYLFSSYYESQEKESSSIDKK